jgi:hypothetical protein
MFYLGLDGMGVLEMETERNDQVSLFSIILSTFPKSESVARESKAPSHLQVLLLALMALSFAWWMVGPRHAAVHVRSLTVRSSFQQGSYFWSFRCRF